MKRPPFFNTNPRKPFQDVLFFFLYFIIWKLLLLKWRPLQYNGKFEQKACFLEVFIRLLSKNLRTNYPVLTKISKFHASTYCNSGSHNLAFPSSKMAALQI